MTGSADPEGPDPAPGAASGRLRSQTVRGSLWTLISTGANLPLVIAATLVIARTFSPQELGRFALLSFILQMTLWIATAGVPMALQRRLSLAHGSGATSMKRQVLRMEQAAATGHMTVVTIVAVLVLHRWQADVVMLAYALVATVTGPAAVYLTATNRGAFVAKATLAAAAATAASQAALAPLTHSADITAAGGFLAGALGYAAMLLATGKRGLLFPGWEVPRLSRADWRFGVMSLVSGQVAAFVFSRSELLFFGGSMGVARGRFAAATTVGSRTTLLIDSLFGTVAPALTTLYGRDDTDFQRGVRTVLRLSAALFVALFPGALVAAVVLTPYVFPSTYGDLRWWVLPLLVVSLLQTGVQPLLSAWTAKGHAGAALTAGLVAAIVDLAISASLIPLIGLPGAVIANVAAASIYVIAIVIAFRRVVPLRVYLRYWSALLTAIAVGAVMAAGVTASTDQRAGWALLGLPVAGVVSAVLLVVLRPLKSDDLDVLPQRLRGVAGLFLSRRTPSGSDRLGSS